MTGDDSSGERVGKEWPLEGHFVIGGSWGLQVHTECLGRTFTSRTASYDLEIGLPQRDTEQEPIPEKFRQFLGPPVPNMELIPPEWAYGPVNDQERQEERRVSPVWGTTLASDTAKVVYSESARDTALVSRCRFHTTVEASDEDEFEEATKGFLTEFDDWWTRFTAWVGVVTGQDFLGLGGYMRQGTKSGSIQTWTCDANGQRAGRGIRSSFPPPRYGIPPVKLGLADVQRCVNATGRQDPPAEWSLIRDARLLLNTGHIRRAVLDAGTAAEIAMNVLVGRCLDEANTEEAVKKAMTDRYDSLGAMNDLLGSLKPDLLSPHVNTDLISKRNIAIHGRSRSGRRWDEITVDEAIKAIETAAAIVDAAHPLADLLA
jgi:hypothetical protein